MSRTDDLLLSAVERAAAPHFLVFFVTRHCNFRCPHCLLGDLPDVDADAPFESSDLTLAEIQRIAKSMPRVGAIGLTGGDPFVRRDFEEIALIFVRARKAKRLEINTNGWFPKRVEETARKLLDAGAEELDIRVSLDGPPAIHDEVRLRPGSHDKAVDTLRRLVAISRRDSRLHVGTLTTFVPKNRQALLGYLPFLKSLGTHTHSLILWRGPDVPPLTAEEQLRFRETYAVYNAANESVVRRAYKSIVLEMVTRAETAPCAAGRLVAVLRENGDLFPCEQRPERLASLRDYDCDFPAAWKSAQAEQVRREIRGCTRCAWEPVLAHNICTSPPLLAQLAWRTSKELVGQFV